MAPDRAAPLPDWITYPGDAWESITPEEAGLDETAWSRFLADSHVTGAQWEGERHGDGEWGAVLTRGGYIVHTWGNPDYAFQTASLGKAFTWAVFGLATDAGLVKPDDLIRDTWTGVGQLSHGHKHLDAGHHRTLSWRHLLGSQITYGHDGGFPVTNGFFWRQRSSGQMKSQASNPVPEWANWTGDPNYDNYSHAAPGRERIYSSGGIWRLSQALTALWGRDIKSVIDERLLSKIGIGAGDWDWIPGKSVHDNRHFYPDMPGYGDFLDAPYEINGQVVRGGGGWVVMSAGNLARFGHLVATQGLWNGERLISSEWIRGHGGGNKSLVSGESNHYTAFAKVTTEGVDHPLPDELFAGPVRVTPA